MRRRLLYHKATESGATVEDYKIVIETFRYDDVEHDVTEIVPVISYYYIPVYSDGTEGDTIYNTSSLNEASVSFSIATDYPNTVSVDKDGIIHCDAWEDYLENLGQYRLVGTVTMKVSLHKPNTTTQTIDAEAEAEARQASVDITWNAPVVTLTYEPNPAPAQPDEEGGVIKLIPTVKWTQTGTYGDGTPAPEHNETNDSSASYIFTSLDGNLKPDQSDGTIIVDSSEIESEHDLGTIQVQVDAQGKTGYGTCLIKQQEYYPPVEVQNLMDVVFYNKNNGKLCIMNRLKEDYTNYPKATYTPIGIVIAECVNDIHEYGQNGYNAGKGDGFTPQTIGIMALNNAKSSTLLWGGVNDEYWIIDGLSGEAGRIYSIPVYGTGKSDMTTSHSNNGNWADDIYGNFLSGVVGIPSDLFVGASGAFAGADEDAYYNGNFDMYALSPYKSGLFYYNTEYWTNIYTGQNGTNEYNCFSDFAGEEKTQTYLHQMVKDTNDESWLDYSKESTIVSDKYMLPAMEACYKYYTDGTGQGTWYLPAAGELGHIIARTSAINATLNELASTYQVSVTLLPTSTNDTPFLTSTVGFADNAQSHIIGYTGRAGMYMQYNEDGAGYVRPFKRMDVYYSDDDYANTGAKEGYYHDSKQTEKEWYDQIPVAYKDEYAQHIGVYRNSSAAGSSNYPSGNISGILYGVLVKGEDDFTVIRTDVPLFEISSLATGETIVKTFDQNPQCGWYVPQYIGENNTNGITFINQNSTQLQDNGKIQSGDWRGTVSVWNRCDGDAEDVGSNYGNDTTGMKAFKAGDWSFNIAIVFHASSN